MLFGITNLAQKLLSLEGVSDRASHLPFLEYIFTLFNKDSSLSGFVKGI